MSFYVIIPARYASSRLPGKPLADIAGKPMIQHVYEAAQAAGPIKVVVATDDHRVQQAVEGFGGEVIITSPHHTSGTARLSEAATLMELDNNDIVINLQGDEPLIPVNLLRQVASLLNEHRDADVATLCTRIHTAAELFDPHVVKVVMDRFGYALYFSRAVIPWDRDAFAVNTAELPSQAEHYRHLGLYAYRVGFLDDYVQQAPCALEQMESLEQLRVLWNGNRIVVGEAAEPPGHGVDTPADLERVRTILAQKDESVVL